MHNPINKEKIELVVRNAMPKGISGLLAALRQTQELLCTHLLTAAVSLFILGGLTVTSVVGLVRAITLYQVKDDETLAPLGMEPSEYIDDIGFLATSVLLSTVLFGLFSASTAYAYICLRENEFRPA